MIDNSMSGMAYNRFVNLDSVEDRVIYFLLSPNNKTEAELKLTHTIWRLLYYNDIDALSKPLPKYQDVVRLIYNDNGAQDDYRIFKSPRVSDTWNEECSAIKIYIDSIIPENHLNAVVNIGIDVITHSKIINVTVPEDEVDVVIDVVDGVPIRVGSKSRVTVLTQAVLSLLNGADLAGVGRVIYSRKKSIQNQSQYGLWNNRNFEGIKNVIGVSMSGVS